MDTEGENAPKETGEAETGHTRPAAKFTGTGGLSAAVWKQKSENGPDHYSVRLDRRFKNNSGGFESTPYLREGDLLRAQKLLGHADDWIEQDRAKHKSGQQQDGGGRQ